MFASVVCYLILNVSFTSSCKSVDHLFSRLEVADQYVLGAADGELGRERGDVDVKTWLS